MESPIVYPRDGLDAVDTGTSRDLSQVASFHTGCAGDLKIAKITGCAGDLNIAKNNP